MSVNSKCPCGSKLKYKVCCKPFHDGKIAKNARELMRSRYSAYASHVEKYIVQTTHQKNKDFTIDSDSWKQSIKNFSTQTRFEKLEILEFIDGETEAFVTFKATLTSNGEDSSFTEKSSFIKENGRWYYLNGEFINK